MPPLMEEVRARALLHQYNMERETRVTCNFLQLQGLPDGLSRGDCNARQASTYMGHHQWAMKLLQRIKIDTTPPSCFDSICNNACNNDNCSKWLDCGGSVIVMSKVRQIDHLPQGLRYLKPTWSQQPCNQRQQDQQRNRLFPCCSHIRRLITRRFGVLRICTSMVGEQVGDLVVQIQYTYSLVPLFEPSGLKHPHNLSRLFKTSKALPLTFPSTKARKKSSHQLHYPKE